MQNKKFLPIIKVGGRRVVKKNNPSRGNLEKLKKILDKNKATFTKSAIDELVIERGSKLYKYKSNIKIVLDSNDKPIGVLLSGIPEVKNKLIFDIPEDFEGVVEDLNKKNEQSELEKAMGID
jgi:hypothetical protein